MDMVMLMATDTDMATIAMRKNQSVKILASDMNNSKRIAIIGLGYVGLPLAVEFSKKYPVAGFDINNKRISDLKTGNDLTLEIDKPQLLSVLKTKNDELNGLFVTSDSCDISSANIYIITVPTPIDKH